MSKENFVWAGVEVSRDEFYEAVDSYKAEKALLCRKDGSSKPKHSHYHKDVSQYDTMDIYAICKVWNVESSGCTFAAVKKLLNAGERGAKDRITDLEQAIESIEALIKLVKMDVGQ